jgi:predicted dehydrogenase
VVGTQQKEMIAMEKLSVAIIGAGQIAGGFDQAKNPEDTGTYTHAGAFKDDGRFRLAAVYDLDIAAAERFKAVWQVEAVYGSLGELYADRFDVVSVCTPDATHFDILKNLLLNKTARIIVAEKPIALNIADIAEIERLSREQGIPVVVNLQRRQDGTFAEVRRELQEKRGRVLAGNVYYIKGLEHNGVAAVDTLVYLFGAPRAVRAYNRVYNLQVADFTYEFICFYDGFNITVKTIDKDKGSYNYHMFEIDILTADGRITINDNSRQIERRSVGDFAYSGVKALDDVHPVRMEAGFRTALLRTVDYIHGVVSGTIQHSINTPYDSLLDKHIIETILLSYERGQLINIDIEDMKWKK